MKPQVTAEPLTDYRMLARAAGITAHDAEIRVPLSRWYRAEHSPIRCLLWWIDLRGIPYRVSVHLARHKIGVEHFVSTTRPDLAPDGGSDSKSAPVNHGMLVNAQALITMSRKRLCYRSHHQTVETWLRVRRAVGEHDPDLRDAMVPECVYRARCPEMTECHIGEKTVRRMYEQVGPARD